MSRKPWGHTSRYCTMCGKVGPRVIVFGGWAHRYCIDGKQSPTERMRQKRRARISPVAAEKK